jgi:hypothetical protein
VEPILTPGVPAAGVNQQTSRSFVMVQSSSCRARIESEGLSGGRESLSTVVVASLWSRVGVGNGKRTWKRRGLSRQAAPWTPIAGVG